MSTDTPRAGYTPIYKDGETKYIRPGTFDPIWKPQGWTLTPAQRRSRRRPVRRAPVPVPEVIPDLPMPRPGTRTETPPGLTMKVTLNLTPPKLVGFLLGGSALAASTAVVLRTVF